MTQHITIDRVQLLYGVSGLAALWLGWIIKARPRWRRTKDRVSAALDTFVGRDEEYDELSGRTLPAVLPLHKRLTGIENAQEAQAAALARLAQVQADQTEILRITTDHEARILSLEDVEAERSLTREESASMWRAIEHKDVIDVENGD